MYYNPGIVISIKIVCNLSDPWLLQLTRIWLLQLTRIEIIICLKTKIWNNFIPHLVEFVILVQVIQGWFYTKGVVWYMGLRVIILWILSFVVDTESIVPHRLTLRLTLFYVWIVVLVNSGLTFTLKRCD